MRKPFVLLFLVALINAVSGRWTDDAFGQTKCRNTQFRKNRNELFHYTGIVENGIMGTTNNVTKMKITAKVQIVNWNSCDFHLKVTDAKIYESLGSFKDNYNELKSDDLVKRLSSHALRFVMQNGVVTHVSPSVKSTQTDVLNIQRGILSMIQVRQVKDEMLEVTEDDVSGSCQTKYVRDYKTGHGIVDDQVEHIDKIKDLDTCKGHQISHSNIYGDSFDEGKEGVPKNPVLKSTSVCSYKLNKKKRVGLKNVICKEYFLVQPFSSETEGGAYVRSWSELSRKSSTKINKQQVPYKEMYSTAIMYDHNHQHVTPYVSSFKTKVRELLNNLATNDYHKSNFNTAENFFDLVLSFRHLSSEDIASIVYTMDIKKEAVRFYLFDAMAQCGTPSCMGVLFKIMKEKNLQSEAFRFMPYLAFIKEPTPEVIRLLTGIYQQTRKPSVLLLLTSLIYRMCQHRNGECDQTGMIGKVVEDSEYYILRLLGNDCQTHDFEKQQNIFYSLRSIGNMGRPTKAIALIMDCVKNAQHTNISVAAIQALRRMKITSDVKGTFYEILTDKSEELEKRIEIFLMLMKSPTRTDVILARDLANDEQESSQMRSLINSYLRSATKNKDPTKKKITALITKILKEYPLTEYDPSPARYSKAFLHSLNLYKHAATVDGMVLFHPESFVPRTINLNVSTHMFGFSVNPLELNARMEGLEMLLGKYFAGNGYFSGSYLKKIFKIPEEKLTRRRRDVDEDNLYKNIDERVNMKLSSPQALLSLKVFGNEIQMFTLEDIPFLNGKLDNLNIIKELYDLTKGKQRTFKRNIIILEVSHSVPTILGLPLKIGVNSSAVITTDVKGRVVTNNLLFGPKSVTMHGSLKPSVSIHASGKLTVECLGVGKIGTSFHANMLATRKLHGKLDYNEGKEIKVDLNADKSITDVFNVSYDIFHLTTQQKEPINAIAKMTEGSFCSEDIFNSSFLFGSNTCMDVSFPNAYYNLSSPYFPLTGPLHVGIRSYPTDPLLKKYRLSITNDGGLYAISVGTPGATSERKHTIRLGITKQDDRGVIGVSFGEKRKGIVLTYNFNKETNEIDTTLRSNFTKTPISIFGKFFNETNPSTLNQNVGGAFHFALGKYYMKHKIFYKNTYEYWALGTQLEYTPGRTASLDVKIQYNPQFFHLNFTHAPTNTQILASALPSLPVLEGGINITHGNSVNVKTFGRIDILKYEVLGDVSIQPGHHVKADGKWIPKEKRVFLNGNINGATLRWDAGLKYEKKSNVLTNTLQLFNKKLENSIYCNRNKVHASLSFNHQRSTFDLLWNRSNSHIAVDSRLNMNGQKSSLKLQLRNSSTLHKGCITGNVLGITELGYCLQVDHQPSKKGIMFNVLMPEGNWISPIKLMRTTNSSGFMLTLKFMEMINLIYGENTDTLRLKLQGFGLGLGVKKSKDSFDVNELKLTRRNDTGDLVFDFYGSYHKSLVGQEYMYKAKFNKQFWIELRRKNTDIILSIFDERGVIQHSVVLRSSKTTTAPSAKNIVYIDWNKNTNRLSNFEIFLDKVGWFQITGAVKNGLRQVIINSKPFGAQNSKDLKMTVLTFDESGNVKYQIMLDNPMMKELTTLLQPSVNEIIGNTERYIATGLRTFGGLLKLETGKVDRLIIFLTKGMKEYFSVLHCNGKEIQERYIEKKITKETIIRAVLKTLELPFSNEFQTMFQNQTGFGIGFNVSQQATNAFKAKNFLSFFDRMIRNELKTTVPKKYSNVFPSKSNTRRLNIFEKEYLVYLQKIINLIQTSYGEELKDIRVKQSMTNLTKYLPAKYKNKLVSVIQHIVRVLKTWRYDSRKSTLENIEDFQAKINQGNIDKIFEIDYFTVVAKSILARSRFPVSVERAFKLFFEDSNYVNFITRLSRFALQTYRVTGSNQRHIQQLLNSKSMSDYFQTLATLITTRGRLGPARTKPFKEFLKTRKIKALFTALLKLLKERHQVSDTGIAMLETMLLHEDLKTLSLNGIPALFEGNFVPAILKKIVLRMKEEPGNEVIFKLISLLNSNLTDFTDELRNILSEDNSLQDSILLMYKLILKTSKQHIGGEYKYASSVEGLFTKFVELSLQKTDIADEIKKITLLYYDSLAAHLKLALPKKWYGRFEYLSKNVRSHITKIAPEELKRNSTDEFLKVFSNMLDDVMKSLPDEMMAFVQTDLIGYLKNIASRYQIHNETAGTVYARTWKKHNEYMLFLIRLFGQFSQSERNAFAEKFVKNGKIQYYKIYQSIWQNKLVNRDNMEQVSKLFDGLETRAFEEILKFTGNYSIVATVNNVFNYIKSLNYSDINSVIESYRNIDVTNFQNLTISALQHNFKTLLEDIGKIKHDGKSIDDLVYQSIPNFIAVTSKMFHIYNSSYYMHLYQLDMQEKLIEKGFQLMSNYVKQAQQGENKFLSFLLEVLTPGIDGLFLLAQKSRMVKNNQMFLSGSKDRCTQIFLIQQQAMPDSVNDELDTMLKQYLNSSQCDVINFFDDVQQTNKDKFFLGKVLEKIRKITIKMYDENRKEAWIYLQMAKQILKGTKIFAKERPGNTLQKLVFHMSSRLSTAVRDLTVFRRIKRVIKRSISLDDLDMKMIVKKFLAKQLKNVLPRVSIERMNTLGRNYITSTVRSINTHAQNTSRMILKGIDDVKTPLSGFKFVTDPTGYLKSLPEILLKILSGNIMKNKHEILSNLYLVEKELRRLYADVKNMLEKHKSLPKEMAVKIRTSYKNVTSQYLDTILKHVEKYDKTVNDNIKALGVAGQGKLKQKFALLSKQTRTLRNKYKDIQLKFINDLKRNVSLLLNNNKFKKIGNSFGLVKNDARLKDLKKIIGHTQSSLQQIIEKAIYPQIQILATAIDKTVCDIKTNTSKVYTKENNIATLSLKVPKSNEVLKEQARLQRNVMKIVESYSKQLNLIIQQFEAITSYDFLKPLHEKYVKQTSLQLFKQLEGISKEKANEFFAGDQMFQYYADQRPDDIVEQTLLKYQDHIKKIALQVNKAIKISPSTGFEKPIIKFLGLQYKEPKYILQPISRTAYIFHDSLITYDGKAIFLPKNLRHKLRNCKYLLTRDFMWKKFTIYLQGGDLVVELDDGKVIIERYHKNKVHVYVKRPPQNQLVNAQELPVQMKHTTVSKLPNMVKIDNEFGLLIYCRLDMFACNVTVSGHHHNKTLGLLGTNNVEASDDLRMPNGKLALNLLDFLNAYQLTTGRSECVIENAAEVFGDESEDLKREEKLEKCTRLMNSITSKKFSTDISMRSSAFMTVCSVEKTCPAVSALSSSLKMEGEIVSVPPQCEVCKEKPIKMRFNENPRPKVVITLLIKLTPKMKNARESIKRVLRLLKIELGRTNQVEYNIVGYGGSRMRQQPHLQTGGGNVFMSADSAIQALDYLKFDGNETEQRLGFDALKFAGLLEVTRSIRLFFIFDDDASYTNSLQQMIDVYAILNTRSIVLNAVNNYKFKRNVIGKDSFGMRYHVRLAKGESFNSIRFPPPDDYLPLVKQTRGGVFALKAFVSKQSRWQKALPVSLSKAIKLQIEGERKNCKECKCNVCKNKAKEICDFGL